MSRLDPRRPLRRLDALLGRVSMYRLVTLVLSALAAVALALGVLGVLDPTIFAPLPMLASLAVLLIASVATSMLFGRLWGVRAHRESAVITGLLLWFLHWPQTEPAMLAWLAGTATLASLSKYVVAVRGRHLVNPAAAGVVATLILQEVLGLAPADRLFSTWWVASEALFWPVLVGALLVLRRTRRLGVGATLVAVAAPLLVLGLTSLGTAWTEASWLVLSSYPLVFVAGFMISEPLTLPPRRTQQLGVAALAAVVLAWPVASLAWWPSRPSLWVFSSTTELALVISGLVAFGFGQRRALRLELAGKAEVAPGVWEFWWRTPHRPRFRPGQHLEVQVPHRGADSRGWRRVFSIASAPDQELIRLAMAVPEQASSFKRALSGLGPGARVSATGVQGDFVLPADRHRPLLLVAGGIGITPFLSQLPELADRDVVLIYGVPDGEQIPFAAELAEARIRRVLVCPGAPAAPGWEHLPGELVTAELIGQAVPDLKRRRAYVSGPPAMVDALAGELRGRCAGVRTDHFVGY